MDNETYDELEYAEGQLRSIEKKVRDLKELWNARLFQHQDLRDKSFGSVEQAEQDGMIKAIGTCLAELHQEFPDWGGVVNKNKCS